VKRFMENPFGLNDSVQAIAQSSDEKSEETATAPDALNNSGALSFILTDTQRAVLESFGIDTENLPTEITPELEACFTEKLGEARVQEIIRTGDIGAMDIIKAKSCL